MGVHVTAQSQQEEDIIVTIRAQRLFNLVEALRVALPYVGAARVFRPEAEADFLKCYRAMTTAGQ